MAVGHTWVCPARSAPGRAAPGMGKGRQLSARAQQVPLPGPGFSPVCICSQSSPCWVLLSWGSCWGGHLGRLGASGETVQDLGSCRSVGEQHGLPGALPGLGWGVQEGWTAGVAVSTPAVLVQIRIKSTNGSDARVRVRQINIAPAPSRSRAEKYLAEPASGLPAPGMQHPGRAACPLSTGSGGKKSHRPFSFKLCLPALGLPLAGGAGRAVPRAAQGAEEKGESFRLVT